MLTIRLGRRATDLGIGRYLDLYNAGRPHSSIGRQSPNDAYAALLPAAKLAAW